MKNFSLKNKQYVKYYKLIFYLSLTKKLLSIYNIDILNKNNKNIDRNQEYL